MRREKPVFNLLDVASARQTINRHTRMVQNHIRDTARGFHNHKRANQIVRYIGVAIFSLEWHFFPGQGVAQDLLELIKQGTLNFRPSLASLSSYIELEMRGDDLDFYRKTSTAVRHEVSFGHHQEKLIKNRSESQDGTPNHRFLAGLLKHIRNCLENPVVKARMRFQGIDLDIAMAILNDVLDQIPQKETAQALGISVSSISKKKQFLFALLREYPEWASDIADILQLAQ